ncbi:uncharacterized protein L969DRAFT_72226 [Mixia osmundae IAM 14324]|uniref:Carboxylic ester hydrolase n=1 Tax=Mixia osmundae (strain CBS 9802 / IAM 14324 / JCM 22182 / KY 12970) TaxID=764103 RepID=G7E5F7_MIXOS|nr:uncharacterized protein L969DRAFT_72226 [Mixia osmundae IAM 14324]KEI40782.1 hypothetical protein L969DRAFT_72226 [Mixia osmundae IAM 14324]GAA98067.1 hypothetical protein E5Q_04749 [Mixia osmundae IAM 14324]
MRKPSCDQIVFLCVSASSLLRHCGAIHSTVSVIDGQTTITGLAQRGLEYFYDLPYASPPTQLNRFRPPVPAKPLGTAFDASVAKKTQCIGQVPADGGRTINHIITPFMPKWTVGIEDCLKLDIVRPAGTTATSALPILVYFHGGGWQIGSKNDHDGSRIIKVSIQEQTPIIFIAINYRLSFYGWPAGQQIKEAGLANLGLLDQREALHWIQRHITSFGGDPTKVTLQGESAGAFSIGYHTLLNGGNQGTLFRAIIQQSGTAVQAGDVAMGQKHFDTIAAGTGCDRAKDPIVCLREVPLSTLSKVVNELPFIFTAEHALELPAIPRPDDKLFSGLPFDLFKAGKFSKVPVLSGTNTDEGTLFAYNTNITSEGSFKRYLTGTFPHLTPDQLDTIVKTYPQNPDIGSPYGTGNSYAVGTGQSKRLASFLGDLAFVAPRRAHTRLVQAHGVPAWTYLFAAYDLFYLGTPHSIDLATVFGENGLRDRRHLLMAAAWVRFVNDPWKGPGWPQHPFSQLYTTTLLPGQDDYRFDQINTLISLLDVLVY